MRVRVDYETEVPDWYRRAVRQYYGKDGLATREELVDWFRAYGNSMDDDLTVIKDHCGDGPLWENA